MTTIYATVGDMFGVGLGFVVNINWLYKFLLFLDDSVLL